jgi:hypothetical protein
MSPVPTREEAARAEAFARAIVVRRKHYLMTTRRHPEVVEVVFLTEMASALRDDDGVEIGIHSRFLCESAERRGWVDTLDIVSLTPL